MENEFLLRSRTIVAGEAVIDGAILVRGESIAAVIPQGEAMPSVPAIDTGDAWIFPGLVDTHVHINEPGRTEWEGFATATAAAAAGGITTLVDMPLNSDPVTTTLEALRAKQAATAGKLSVDVGFHAGVVPGNDRDLPALLDAGVLGAKAFMVYSGIPEFPAAAARDLAVAMPLLAARGIPLLAHAELDGPVELPPGPGTSYRRYLASRPSSWEVHAIEVLIDLCRATGCPVHVVHLATADALPVLAAARAEGLPVTVETCPHYLHFTAETIPDADTRYKCAPPVREAAHREALWAALASGAIDLIASDHSPCPPGLKDPEGGDFFKAWGGISSLQLGLPVILTECRNRGLPPARIARWMAEAPARLAGLYPRKGVIAPGADADLVVVHPEQSFTVHGRHLRHRHKVTPYDNETLVGVVQTTYLRGRVVYEAHHDHDPRAGRLLVRA